MSAALRIHQINLSRVFGGGEAYTLFFNRALRELGFDATLHVHKDADWWGKARLHGTPLVPSSSLDELLLSLPPEPVIVVTHTSLYPGAGARIKQDHLLTGFAHMPMWGRNAAVFDDYAYLYPVSTHVAESLRAAGCRQVHDEPLYGVVDFSRFGQNAADGADIVANPLYLSDRRKVRDAVLETIQPLLHALKPKRRFVRRPGLTLGILSMLGPIKQFPQLFTILAPILARHPDVNLEVFGYGGYGYIRDMRKALHPIRDRVRFWGAQTRPDLIYPQTDYLMSGLPEKEALGLNIIEAQSCGTPVLAVNAPPFIETVIDGSSGFLYRDPREDGGADFERVLDRLKQQPRPDPRTAESHLQKFSFETFKQRVQKAMDAAQKMQSAR